MAWHLAHNGSFDKPLITVLAAATYARQKHQ